MTTQEQNSVINESAKRILLSIVDNKTFIELGVSFNNVKTERELVINRLNWWLDNMEPEMKTEAPLSTSLISNQVMKLYDFYSNKTNATE